eukprot:gene16745-biopygen5287
MGTALLASRWSPLAPGSFRPAPGDREFALELHFGPGCIPCIRSLGRALGLNWRSQSTSGEAADADRTRAPPFLHPCSDISLGGASWIPVSKWYAGSSAAGAVVAHPPPRRAPHAAVTPPPPAPPRGAARQRCL